MDEHGYVWTPEKYVWYEGEVWALEGINSHYPGYCTLRSVFNSATILTPVKTKDLTPCPKEVADIYIQSNQPEPTRWADGWADPTSELFK